MNDQRPDNLKSEALSILGALPQTYIRLHNERDNAQKTLLLDTVRQVHRHIAESFGEPRPSNISVQSACADLTRWVDVWSWHPYATWWVRQLDHQLHTSQRRAAGDEWFTKHEKVCPACFASGHVEVNVATGEHRCRKTLEVVWSVDEYSDAVRAAIRRHTKAVA